MIESTATAAPSFDSIVPLPLVAAIGASAGGLDALQTLLRALPERTGIAFVVVMHLSPEHESNLAAILGNSTSMPVERVDRETLLETDHVYVISPDRRLEITDGHVDSLPCDEPRGRRTPIDGLFRSLAANHGDGFAVVLSGGGSDGAIGARAVKAAGRVVLVQEPAEAAFDSMPRATIATGVADLVLPAAEIARRLGELAAAKRRLHEALGQDSVESLAAADEAALCGILGYLHARTGQDFSHYKRATVLRRIARRMQVTGHDRLEAYRQHLRAEPKEPQALFEDLLITVTTFFRDPEAWPVLSEKVISSLFEEREVDVPVRVWVPGCATGEEAYSLVMLLIEEAERRERWPEVQLFATDLDEKALAIAREGRYPAAIVADMEPARLSRFFVRENDQHYRVTNAVRERVLFTRHSLLKDPPFTRLDLVSCRNLLIYLDSEVQRKIVDIFNYALSPGGYLFLGIAENVQGEFFDPIDQGHRIYRSRRTGERPRLPDLINSGPRLHTIVTAPIPRAPPSRAAATEDTDLRALLPPSVLVDKRHRSLRILEGAGRYLLLPDGAPTSDLYAMIRAELRLPLLAALDRATECGATTITEPVAVAIDGERHDVSLWVRPKQSEGEVRQILVVFIESDESIADLTEPAVLDDSRASHNRREHRLREQLQLSESRLRASNEEHDAAIEAVRAANEELQSINEEYRSTAEELETSKEEMQSINEELNSVNAELKQKLEEVSRAHDDLENLMSATEIGTLFLDRGLAIQRFTPMLAELFNIKASDRGRQIGDLTHRTDYDTLEEDAREVLANLAPLERETRHADGRVFAVRIRPYRTGDDHIDGVVLTFVDITGHRRTTRALASSEARLSALLESVPDVPFAADEAGILTYLGSRLVDVTGVEPAALLGSPLWADLIHPDDRAHSEALWIEVNSDHRPYEMRHRLRFAGGYRWVITRARFVESHARIADDGAERKSVEWVGTITDVDELTQAELALREADEHRNRFIGLLGHELRNPLAAIGNGLQVLDSVDSKIIDAASAASGVPLEANLDALRRQSRLMSRLVDDLLDLTRINNGKIALQLRRIDLRDSIAETLDSMRPRLDAAGIELEVSLPDGTLWLDADAERLTQMLDNLLDNAIKYSDRGDKVSLSIRRDGDAVSIVIKDTGIGIASDKLETLFEPFAQAIGPEHVGRGGLGLGLSLVSNLVALHGGRIAAFSDGPGTGSEFRLHLPVSRQRAASRSSIAGPEVKQAVRHRILVVDDNPDVADPFALLLKASGHEVEVAHDGASALTAVAAWRPEVAFLDIGMPGMSGLELARRLREDYPAQALTLVALTGFGQAEDIAAVRKAGFDHHLLKPVHMATVRALLNTLDQGAGRREPPFASSLALGCCSEPRRYRCCRRGRPRR